MKKDYFGDKAQQISHHTIEAFGIELFSRHGKAHEMAEMLLFALQIASNDLEDLVKDVFYDSNASVCSVEFREEPTAEQMELILQAAKQCLRQYQIGDHWGLGFDAVDADA